MCTLEYFRKFVALICFFFLQWCNVRRIFILHGTGVLSVCVCVRMYEMCEGRGGENEFTRYTESIITSNVIYIIKRCISVENQNVM